MKNGAFKMSGAPARRLDDDGDLDLVVRQLRLRGHRRPATGLEYPIGVGTDPSDDFLSCGALDDDDFTASELCCACGGGTGCAVSYFVNNGTAASSL